MYKNIKFLDLGKVDFERFLKFQNRLQKRAVREKANYVLFASHNKVFTKGVNEKDFDFAVKVDRGGSVTYFDEGSFMIYFIFKVDKPNIFFRRVIKVLKKLFSSVSGNIYLDIRKTGFYIENQKICSLGFSYQNGYSKHGVSIHFDNDLNIFNTVPPCNLKDVVATSMKKEGFCISRNELKKRITVYIKEVFS